MNKALQNYECEGQLSMFDKAYPVDIRGICDDAYCPECGYSLDEIKQLDCERCPWCGLRIDWTPWHRMNDEEG